MSWTQGHVLLLELVKKYKTQQECADATQVQASDLSRMLAGKRGAGLSIAVRLEPFGIPVTAWAQPASQPIDDSDTEVSP